MRIEDTSLSEIPESACRMGSEFLTKTLPLLDNAYKRWTFDLYATQLSNAKNYLWVSFVIMSACVAFFDQSALGQVFSGYRTADLNYVVLFLLSLTFASALMVFFRGVLMATGSSSCEPLLAIPDTVKIMESEHYLTVQVYVFQRGLMEIYDDQIKKACQEAGRRGHQLALMGEDTRFSICSGLGTLLIYFVSKL